MILTVILPFDLGTGIRVVPGSDTAMLYLVVPESMDRYNESGHASHAHLISIYSPSDADFLSVESVICSSLVRIVVYMAICAVVLPDYDYDRIGSLQ